MSVSAMSELGTALDAVRDRIARHQRSGIGEQDTKAALIAPLLRALGWDLEDLEDVKLEYRRRPNDNPVDYALFLLRTPRLFIEAKSLGAQLDDDKWAKQILGYAVAAGVEWVALTDGNAWRIYNSHATVPVEQKLFRVVRVADPSTHPAQTLRLLAKAELSDHLIDALWKSDVIDRQLHAALAQLFGAEPDAALVRLLRARTSGLTRAEVDASLRRLRPTFDFPVVDAPGDPSGGRSGSETTDGTDTGERTPGLGTPWRHVTLEQLVEAGLARLPLEIEHRFRGTQLRARIEGLDRIVFAGQAYDSLSTAGGAALQSVLGSVPGRGNPATNGWTFWQCRNREGGLVTLDDLRHELYQATS